MSMCEHEAASQTRHKLKYSVEITMAAKCVEVD